MGVGVTFAELRVSNPRNAGREPVQLEMLVDTGALYSVLPGRVLSGLGVEAMESETFTLADGTRREYAVGEAFFEREGRAGTSKVVFGPDDCTPLLGALTLEALGLMVNPVTRELLPMRLFMAGLGQADGRGIAGMGLGQGRRLEA